MSGFLSRRKLKHIIVFSLFTWILYVFGVFHHPFESNFYTDFHYPYDGDIEVLVEKLKNNETPEVKPINAYYFNFNKSRPEKCAGVRNLRLVYIIKSSPENFDNRIAIRSSWGYERRFSDVEIRTVFLVGVRNSAEQQKYIDEESHKFLDIIQANFTDSYFNNTYKTMMGMQWAIKYCSNAKFYMFVDDDYYISTKNVLRFVRHPVSYPQYIKDTMMNVKMLNNVRKPRQVDFDIDDTVRLYTGYTFESSPHRHFSSKWYVSLEEYPYHMWPPYVTAGAFILSKGALVDMYYSSFYTKHFRFDDIYVGLLAFKAKIEPFHCDNFHFYKKAYGKFDYTYTIATHGYGNAKELLHVWTEQKSLGNA